MRAADPAWLGSPSDPLREGETVAALQARSADGELVAVVVGRDAVSVYESRGGALRCRLDGHPCGTLALCFSPSGDRLATAGRDGCVRVWDVGAGKELLRVTEFEGVPRCLAWSADGKRLASGHGSAEVPGRVHLWDAETGASLNALVPRESAPSALAFLPGGDVVTAYEGGQLILWELATGRTSSAPTGSAPRALSFAADGTVVAVGPGWVQFLEVRDRKLVQTWSGGPGGGGSPASVDERRVVAFDRGEVRLHRLPLTAEQTVADATRAARLRPEWDRSLVARGLCHLVAERFGQARADFTRAIELNEKNPAAYLYRALVHAGAGDDDKALNDLGAAIGLNPKSAEAHLQRGLVLLRKGDYRAAKRDLDRAVELDPKLASRLPKDD
jgi:WD40 repeat protein